MKIFFRVLLAVYAFCLAVFSAFAMYVAIFPNAYVEISEYIIQAISTDNATTLRIAVFAVALVFFALSIMFLLSGVRNSKDRKAVSKHTSIGEIKISLNSIENIAINASRKTNGVRDSKTLVRKTDDSVEIEIRIVVMPDMSIPAITEDVQQRVKKSVEDTAGIAVKTVRVIVDSIYTGITYKPRVE
jgi:uncharacterized alkaline shock family protein YloU